jgi:hypothetical protein
VRLTSPPSCAECHEIWEPKPAGTLWATPDLLCEFFTFTCTFTSALPAVCVLCTIWLFSPFPCMLLNYCLSDFEMVPVAPCYYRYHFCLHIPHALCFYCKLTTYTVYSRIQPAIVFADFLNEKKQFAVPIRTFPSTAPCLQGRLIE